MIKISFENGISRFSFTPDEGYAPMTTITCIGLTNNGKIFVAEEKLHFNKLNNKLEIKILTPNVEPGKNASLRVTSALHSTVSLFATDQSEILKSFDELFYEVSITFFKDF